MTPLARDSAEVLAIEALVWLTTDDELLPVFLGSTGAGVDDIRARAQDPEFLASILDFILMDDAWVGAFCSANNYAMDYPMRARAALPGGAAVNWT